MTYSIKKPAAAVLAAVVLTVVARFYARSPDTVRWLTVFHAGGVVMFGIIVLATTRQRRAYGSPPVGPHIFSVFAATALLIGTAVADVLSHLTQPWNMYTPVANVAFALLDYGLYTMLRHDVWHEARMDRMMDRMKEQGEI